RPGHRPGRAAGTVRAARAPRGDPRDPPTLLASGGGAGPPPARGRRTPRPAAHARPRPPARPPGAARHPVHDPQDPDLAAPRGAALGADRRPEAGDPRDLR